MTKFNIHKQGVLFVCTGNTCRSPMAEYLYRGLAKDKGFDVKTASRGVSTISTGGFSLGPSIDSCEIVLKLYPQSKIYTHQPTGLRFKDLDDWDWILTMEETHLNTILSKAASYIPRLNSKVFTLKEFVGETTFDIADPIGGIVSSGGYLNAGRGTSAYSSFNLEDTYSLDNGSSFKSSPDGFSRYTQCKEEILSCLEKLVSGKVLSSEKLIQNRKERTKSLLLAMQEAEKKDCLELLSEVQKAKRRGEVVTTYKLRDYVKKTTPSSKKYLDPVLKEIRRVVDGLELKLVLSKSKSPPKRNRFFKPFKSSNPKPSLADIDPIELADEDDTEDEVRFDFGGD